MSEHKTVFEGEVYIRPLGRGVCLGPDLEDFEDWIFGALGIEWTQTGTEVRARITVERLPQAVGGDGDGQRDE